MLAVDIVIYSLLALYFEEVIPSAYGSRQVPWFFLLPSYWFPVQKKTAAGGYFRQSGGFFKESATSGMEELPIDAEAKVGVKIKNLHKIYSEWPHSKNEKVAIDGVSLKFYEDQIFALLGHNGLFTFILCFSPK